MELDLSLGTRQAEPLDPSTSLKLGFCSVEDEKYAEVGEVEERIGSVNLLLPVLHLPGFSGEIHNKSFEVPSMAEEGQSSRFSDDEENGGVRKKLRLSKEQSAFLEENFKEHSTLKPKQKSALAKQLNLRPRQVEVWFQNRRARTKLKQTEVDCEYLKRCCEALTEENRRLQKELSELRALKATHHFYTQLPATTLSMCAACETASKSTAAAGGGSGRVNGSSKPGPFTTLFAKVHLHALNKPSAAATAAGPTHQPTAGEVATL